MSVTWSPTNKNANVTLSNGNLTATVNVGGPDDAAGVATSAITSGQDVYFEATLVAAGTGEQGIGFANSSFTFGDNNWLGIDGNSLSVYVATGNLYTGGSSQGSIQSGSPGDTFGIAVSRTHNKFWIIDITSGGSFGGAYDPATNSGGFDFTGITGDLFPAFNVGAGSPEGSWTVNFGATSFAGTKPSGFTALDSGGSGVSLSLAATEATDTAALSASLSDSLSLAVTEAGDTAAFSASLSDASSLAATEATDTASFSVTAGLTVALAATEASDTASISADLSDVLSLAANENADTADFAIDGDIGLSLDATDSMDVASFTVTSDVQPVRQSDGGGGGRGFTERGSARIRHREIDAAVDRAVGIIAARNAKKATPVPKPTPKQVRAVLQREEPTAPKFTLQEIDAALARVLAEQDEEEAAFMLLAA